MNDIKVSEEEYEKKKLQSAEVLSRRGFVVTVPIRRAKKASEKLQKFMKEKRAKRRKQIDGGED